MPIHPYSKDWRFNWGKMSLLFSIKITQNLKVQEIIKNKEDYNKPTGILYHTNQKDNHKEWMFSLLFEEISIPISQFDFALKLLWLILMNSRTLRRYILICCQLSTEG